MKTKLLLSSIVLSALCSFSFGQVVIQGGANGVQRSDQNDGTNGANTPTRRPAPPTEVTVPPSSSLGIETNTNSTVRMNPASRITTSPPTESTASGATIIEPVTNVVATPSTPEPEFVTTPQSAKRRAQLAGTLKIREGGSEAELVLRTKNMFRDEDPSQLSDDAIPTMKMISEYLAVTPYSEAQITYNREDGVTSQSEAWERSMSIVKSITQLETKDSEYTLKTPQVSELAKKLTAPIEKGGEEIGDYLRFNFR